MAKPRRPASRYWTALLAVAAALLMQACGGSGTSGGGGGGGGTAPSKPTNLVATAGTLQVMLTWGGGGGTSTAPTFNVLRGTTTGGPYTSLAASLTTATYTDSSVTAGTTYYYVVTATNAFGTSGDSNEASATPVGNAGPPAPTGLNAIPSDKQVSLTWNASTGASSYNLKRSTTQGGPYSTVGSPGTTYTVNGGLSDGTTYYYVVTAVNPNGESAPSASASATPTASTSSVQVSVNFLTNRHAISPYVYGGSYPKDAAHVTDSGLSVVRWGGNGTSTYNWQTQTNNADNDYFWEDFAANGFSNNTDGDSIQFIGDVKAAGSNPLMTMPMLSWVAKTAEGNGNGHWSFSVAKYGAQCQVDQYNTDAGNGVEADCATNLNADPNDAYFPLLDQPGTGDPANSVYRNQWAAAMATAFGTAPHFYDMDNEIDIWGGTHRDIHPLESGYNELRDTFLAESRALKTWDPSAVRFGPVSCCWYFYWDLNSTTDNKTTHAGIDFIPWWLNEVAWSDTVAGTRSLDVFDIHAYPDADTGSLNATEKKALAVSIYRDWWDPTFASAAAYIRNGGFSIEPVDSNPFRIPRMRALANQIYPGTKFSMTEWSAAFAGESDFSTALGDADAYGILGWQNVYLSSRWTAPDPANPNYLALKLFTNYDGAHHGFQTISISTTNNGDPNLFSSYGAMSADGKTMTLMLINKDPAKPAQVNFSFPETAQASAKTYTLAASSPTAITPATPSWASPMLNLPAYSATMLVITQTANLPASEWELNPDAIMAPAGGTVTVSPRITSGTSNVTLINATADNGVAIAIDQPTVTLTQNGAVTLTAASTPGFYRFSVTGADSSNTQTQGGWLVVGKPAATLAKTGDGQSGGSLTLTVTLSPGSSGGTATGASIFFTTDAGTLSQRIVTTNSSGKASVVLTLPSGTAHVTAEGPYGLGHPVVTFTESN